MALLDDITTLALLASAAFFVVLSIGLLVRYREASEKLSESSDLGHDLWQALEQRMKKQDERILDMMGRLEVLQVRVIAPHEERPMTTPTRPPTPAEVPEKPTGEPAKEPITLGPEPRSQLASQTSQVSSQVSQETPSKEPSLILDKFQLAAIRFLRDKPKDTSEITKALKKTREHTARVMKELFDLGLVRRNDSTKPFVYQLTDEGRRYLS